MKASSLNKLTNMCYNEYEGLNMYQDENEKLNKDNAGNLKENEERN